MQYLTMMIMVPGVIFDSLAVAYFFGAIEGIEPRDMIIALVFAGGVLLLLETILPGMVAGLLGVACLVAAIVMGYANFGVQTGNFILAGITLGLVIGTFCWIKYFPTSRAANLFVSTGTVGGLNVEKPELLDQIGVAHTNLHPSGTAIINGTRVDVVTEGPLVEQGTPVKVIALEGIRVVVRAITAQPVSTNKQ